MAIANFADRLLAAIDQRQTPLILGLDPVYEKLPPALTSQPGMNDSGRAGDCVNAMFEFCRQIIAVAAMHVAAVKINSAYFERYQWRGWQVYGRLVQEARDAGLLVIGDVKRADIGHTAEQYAAATLADSNFGDLGHTAGPDAITINPYFGGDGIKPFTDLAQKTGKGVFILLRTSNPSAGEIQEIPAADGQPLYQHVADHIASWGQGLMGSSGFSAVGAVVGATTRDSLIQLRRALPHTLFLIPGIGAQGGNLQDCAHVFDRAGHGAVISASRSIIFAYRDQKYAGFSGQHWSQAVLQALLDTRNEIAAALPATRR